MNSSFRAANMLWVCLFCFFWLAATWQDCLVYLYFFLFPQTEKATKLYEEVGDLGGGVAQIHNFHPGDWFVVSLLFCMTNFGGSLKTLSFSCFYIKKKQKTSKSCLGEFGAAFVQSFIFNKMQ